MDIVKSENDPCQYLYFDLPNRMKCLVISDSETDMASASMDVNIGSLQDPKQIPGLAHFLQHMLFLGTQKYPVQNYYSNFISNHAGGDNAFTDTQDTNFYFKVAADHLKETLDIFAQFFVAPLLTEDGVQRELNAVNSEHSKNINSDGWRTIQLVRNSALTGHQFNHFATGNLETLNKPETYMKVREFYQNMYSSNLMGLVVYGKQETTVLKQWVQTFFSSVVDKDYSDKVDMEMPYSPGVLGHISRVVPVMDKKTLRIFWVLPPVGHLYKTKPLRYFSHLIGHQGKNSLLSMLKSEGLAQELSAGSGKQSKNFSFLTVNIQLTEKGLEKFEIVVQILYTYIQKLKEAGPQEWVFEQIKSIADAEFRFKSKKDPISYTSQLSGRLHRFPPAELITANDLFSEFNAQVIQEFLDHLVPEWMQIYLFSQTFSSLENLETEKWYGTKYTRQKISESLFDRCKNPQFTHDRLELGLPVPNKYIPTEFTVLPKGEFSIPQKILDDQKFTVFLKQDDSFQVDKVCGQVMIFITDNNIGKTAESLVLLRLWKKIWWDKFRQENYQADVSGLRLAVTKFHQGLKMSLSGFSQHYTQFVIDVVESLWTTQIVQEDLESFQDYKKLVVKSFENHFFAQPTTQILKLGLDALLVNGHFTSLELLQAAMNIEFVDLICFGRRIFKNVRLEILLTGNIGQQSCLSMTNKLGEFMEQKKTGFIPKNRLLSLKTLKIYKQPTQKSRSQLVLQTCLIDSTNVNSVAYSNFQVGPQTNRKELALLTLINQVCKENCYDQLRTKEQLGYIVSSFIRKLRGLLHFTIIIQSSVASPCKMTSRISNFIDLQREQVKSMTDQAFQVQVEASVKAVTKKDVGLAEEFRRFVGEIDSGAYWFTRKEDLEQEIRGVSKEEFQEAYERILYRENRRLDLELVSSNLEGEHQELQSQIERKVVKNSNQLQRTLNVRPEVYIRN